MVMPKQPKVAFDEMVDFETDKESTCSTASQLSDMKKMKISTTHAKKIGVIADLNAAVNIEDRVRAIALACKEFDHYDKQRHAREIDEGAVNALYQKLCLTLAAKNREEIQGNELNLIFSALEMVHRCSTAKRNESFEAIGSSLLSASFYVLELCLSMDTEESDATLMSILQLLYYFSRVQSAAIEILQQPGILPSFISIILGDKNDSIRAKVMVTLADLACVQENGNTIVKHDGLLDSVVQVANLDLASEMRELATRALQNISFHIDETIPKKILAEIMLTLVKAEGEGGPKIQKYVSGALQNLSTSKANRHMLVSLNHGCVIDTLMNLLRSDDPDAKIRAIGAIKNLASKESSSYLWRHRGFISVLSSVATNDFDPETKHAACEALHWLSQDMTAATPGFKEMLSALVQAAQTNVGPSIALAFYEQSQVPGNVRVMAAQPGLLECLSKMAKPTSDAPQETKENAVAALSNLARRME